MNLSFIKLLRIESALLFILFLLVLIYTFGFSWHLLYLFWIPDVSFIGYFFGPRIGAYVYNFAHYLVVGAILIGLGVIFNNNIFIYVGLLQTAHVHFDRMLGYGLKSTKGFKITHLGDI